MKKMKHLLFTLIAALFIACGSAVVVPETVQTVEAATVKISKTRLTLNVGQQYRLKVTGASGRVRWKSSRPKVASVTSKGLVVAKKAGKARIVATVGGKKYACVVTVKAADSSFYASETSIDIHDEGSVDITYEGSGTLRYHVDDRDVCECEWQDGWNGNTARLYIYGLSTGSTAVTITNTQDSKKVVIEVNVDLDAREVTLSSTHETLKAGETCYLTAKVSPSYVRDKSVRWKSSDTDVASVSGGTVTARKEGTATITATSADGKAEAECIVEVTEAHATRIELSETNITLNLGDDMDLTAEVYPPGLDYDETTLEWESSNENVATVGLYGHVRAKGLGTAVITVTNRSGSASAQCTVTVVSPLQIILPNLPVVINNYDYRDRLTATCTITNVRYEVATTGTLYLYFDGHKDFDSEGSGLSRYFSVGYKLYRDNAVVESGTARISPVAAGNSFVDQKELIFDLTPGTYRLELLDVR